MGGENNKNDLWGLSLSLSPPNPITNLGKKPLCKREPHFSPDEQSQKMHKPNNSLMIMPSMMEMDIKPQLVIDLEEVEVNKVGSPNSTLSSHTGKRHGGFRGGDRDVISDEDDDGSGSGGGGGGGGGGEGCERKKLRLSKDQIMVLEQAFREHTTLNTKQKLALAREVNLRPRQVEVWFQNRRARTKLKQTEVDCENWKRFCETLTEQNRKLQKEVQELRALKVSPEQSVMQGKNHHHYPGAATLNMCPSCKNVSRSSSSATTSKTTTSSEAGCYMTGVLHRPVPLNLNNLSLTINNNNMMFDSHPPRA